MSTLSLKYFQVILFVCFLFSFNSLGATVRYVSKTGSSTPPYTTWATAADSIQKCIDISVFGDTIYVGNGVYKEQVKMIPGLALIGSGMDSCVIDTRELVQPTDFSSVTVVANCLLEGFHIIVSHSNWGVGIYASAPSSVPVFNKIQYNKITKASWGVWLVDIEGGYCNDNIISNAGNCIRINNFFGSGPIIENNYLSDILDIGIVVAFSGKPIIRNNTMMDSDLSRGIFAGGSDSLFLNNNLLLLEEILGEAISLPLSPNFIINNLLSGDTDSRGITAQTESRVYNNHFENFEYAIVREINDDPDVKYNSFWKNITNIQNSELDSTNLTSDPMFIDEEDLDFHLQAFSPLIDKGNPAIFDKDGSRSDVGLYGGPDGESYLYIDLPPKAPRNLLASLDSGIVNLRWNRNTETDLKYYNIYRDTVQNFTIDTTKVIAIASDTTFSELLIGSSNLYYKITAVDGSGNESLPGEEVSIIVVGIEEPKLIIEDYILYQNYPNPFNPSTTIGYRLNSAGYVKLNVYDIKGEKITSLVNEYQNPGYYETIFSAAKRGDELASGIYLYKLEIIKNQIPVYTSLKKMIQLK